MTNNTDGAALLPCPNPWCEADDRDGDFRPQVQYSNFGLCYVACTSCKMAGPTRNHEAEAIAAWNTRAPLHATQEDAERSVVEGHLLHALKTSNWVLDAIARECCDSDSPPEVYARKMASDQIAANDATLASLSTPQRQEYDGEAVDDAVSRLRGWLAAGEQYARAGSTMRLDVFVSIALAQLDGTEPPTTERLGWAIDGIKAHVDDELLGDDLRTLLAALAHPAQATPSAGSGDAGEGE